ncbi:protein RETARDED ROOT GROWTH, mitochondrial [Diospyros lotus]|uniref:protein RETARDED ROOT GROWTH, mitochondrial n=1 Tax=Diospyros lotus TaxID=55363 RepID=UPI00224D2913|nr:protein RETARDED ROOT GROWTH, mitochondrial [Diospyros lotus]
MGRCGAFCFILSTVARIARSAGPNPNPNPNRIISNSLANLRLSPASKSPHRFFDFRGFSALPSPSTIYSNEFDYSGHSFEDNYALEYMEDAGTGKIPIKAYFLCTSIDLKGMHAENSSNVIPPTSRSSNYIALRFCNFPSKTTGIRHEGDESCCCYMVVFQYGSAVLFNVEDHDAEAFLEIIRRHASGLLPEMRKDDYAVKEMPLLVEDMQGGPDFIVLKNIDTDSIRIIGSVLGQSIALDYFVSQVDSMVEEFTDINRGMEKTGTFTMNRKKLFKLVGKANSNLADVILKVGLFDRSEIAWRDAKYAQIYEYLREEYEVAQRFGNLDFKLKFVEHNIHFLQEVLQNRRSDLLEWCIIFLLSIENVISVYEIVHDSTIVPV